ncbi:MAG: colicin [Pseudomonadota bacterium]
MSDASKIPSWLYHDFWSVLFAGEVYPQMRAIAVSFDENVGRVLARFYFDREPTEFDCEAVDIILSLLAAKYGGKSNVRKIDEECVYSNSLIKDLDSLDGFVFTRREYEMSANPSQKPNYELSN